MNICLITLEWPPCSGGIGTYTFILAKGLSEAGHNVTVITHANQPVKLPGVTIKEVPLSINTSGLKIKLFKWLHEPHDSWSYAASKVFQNIQNETSFDIVEVPEYGAWGRHIKKNYSKPIIVTRCHNSSRIVWAINNFTHNSYKLPSWIMFQDYKEWRQTQYSDAVTCPSYSHAHHTSLQWVIDRSRITVIPNPIDVSTYKPDSSLGKFSDKKRVLYVGRLQIGKGILDFSRAAQKLLQDHPDIEICIAGMDTVAPKAYRKMGETIKEVVQSTLSEREKKRFLFLGELGLDDLIRQYRNAYCVVIPTRGYESFSYTCAEAMSCGCPTIATRCGGPQEIIDDAVDGFLVNPGASDEIVHNIELLLNDTQLRNTISQAARKKIEQKFATEKVVADMLSFYQRLCDEK